MSCISSILALRCATSARPTHPSYVAWNVGLMHCLLCVDCDSDVHWLQPFHDREVWKFLGIFSTFLCICNLTFNPWYCRNKVYTHIHMCKLMYMYVYWAHVHTHTRTHIHMHTALHMHSHMHAFILLDICLCSLFLHVVRVLPSKFPLCVPTVEWELFSLFPRLTPLSLWIPKVWWQHYTDYTVFVSGASLLCMHMQGDMTCLILQPNVQIASQHVVVSL